MSTLTLEEGNQAAKDSCSRVTCFQADVPANDRVLIVTVFSPKGSKPGDEYYCDEETLVKTVYEACQIDVKSEEYVPVPHSLISEEDLKKINEKNEPAWESGKFSDGIPDTPADKLTRPLG